MAHGHIVFVGGGTGGHFYPLIAVAEALILECRETGKEQPQMYYMGPEPYDAESLAACNITFVRCTSGKQRRYLSLLNFVDAVKVFFGILIALWKLYIIYPDVILSKGGYTSVPVVIAGWLLRIPIIVHESDAKPGRANTLGGRFARYIAISYPDAAQYFPQGKTFITGIPLRHVLRTPARGDAAALLGITSKHPLLLVLGGSQGAERINQFILETLNELLPMFSILHQTGAAHFTETAEAAKQLVHSGDGLGTYIPVAFLKAEEMNQAYHLASIVISRAGSGTIFEIAAHGKPAILIPIPETISHDQRTNAYAYARTGAAVVLEEENLVDSLLMAEISRIMEDTQLYDSMSKAALAFVERNSAEKIAGALLDIVSEHS